VGWEGYDKLSREILVRAEEQLAKSVAGDQSAFGNLVREHQAMVFSLAYHFLRDRSLAEELAQEVFLLLHQNLSSIKSPAHLTFWLRKVTSHRCIDQARRQQARPQMYLEDVPEPAAEDKVSDPMLSKSLNKMVEALPENARMVLILRYQEDLEPTEIAEVTGMPLNTVKSHLRRSLATLREKLIRCIGEVNV
jgi:RNA polymerase sigma-70 factor, ECF subfamily